MYQRIWEKNKKGFDRQSSSPKSWFWDQVLQQFENNLNTSTSSIANVMPTKHAFAWRMLNEFLKYRSHVQKLQTLLPADYPNRVQYTLV